MLNISSPNTPGPRALQDQKSLDDLLGAVQRRNTRNKPMLVKIAPDLEWEQIEEIIRLAEEHAIAGIIATNTSTDHSSLPAHRRHQGGLSGSPLRQRSTEIVRFITERTQLPVIAVGGIDCVDAALEKADAWSRAAASLYRPHLRRPRTRARHLQGAPRVVVSRSSP